MDWTGENGFSATMTCQCNRLPAGIPSHYLHKEKSNVGCNHARVARFNNLITLVQTKTTTLSGQHDTEDVNNSASTEHVSWTRVHVSFQSTNSTNISTVNALNQNQLFGSPRQRGQGNNKRKWVIEINEARQLYSATYGRIDTIDQLIKKCRIYYCTWKYWHSMKNHVLALACVVAYDMYNEIMQEAHEDFHLTADEAAASFLDFHTFREQLSTRGLTYDPTNKLYKEDRMMRINTKKSAERRQIAMEQKHPKRRVGRPTLAEQQEPVKITPNQLKSAKRKSGQLCGDLTKLMHHMNSIQRVSWQLKCAWCGEATWTRCKECNIPYHHKPVKGDNKGEQCFFYLHDDALFGLARCDCPLLNKKKQKWETPTPRDRYDNKTHIDSLQCHMPYQLRNRDAADEDE